MQTSTIASLRTRIAALERGPGAAPAPRHLPFGASELDDRLPGRGLALGAVHEVFAGGPAVEHGAAPALFVAGVLARRPGPVVWIVVRRDLYPPALARAGLDPGRIVFVEARQGALRAMEESLRHPGLAGVVCEHEGRLDLTASPRLQLAAEATNVLGFVLRRSRRFDDPALGAPSAASICWRITGLPSHPPLPHAPDVPGCRLTIGSICAGSVAHPPRHNRRPVSSTTQIAVSFYDTSKPTNRVIEPPPMVQRPGNPPGPRHHGRPMPSTAITRCPHSL